MPRESQYTEKVMRFMRSAQRPVTATEIQEAAGMSRQAAYQWLSSNDHLVREVGKGRNSAAAYVLEEDAAKFGANFKPHGGVWTANRPPAPEGGSAGRGKKKSGSSRDGSADGQGLLQDIAVGNRICLTVTAVRLLAGEVIIEVTADTGRVWSVPMAAVEQVHATA